MSGESGEATGGRRTGFGMEAVGPLGPVHATGATETQPQLLS